MDQLRQWAYSVAVTVVFGTLAETVLPTDSYKKYIRLILGMILLLTLTKPAFALVRGGFADAADYAASFASAAERTEQDAHAIEERQKRDVVKIYKDALESSVAAGLERECGVKPVSVEAEISDSAFGSVEGMVITIDAADAPMGGAVKNAAADMTGLAPAKITLEEE